MTVNGRQAASGEVPFPQESGELGEADAVALGYLRGETHAGWRTWDDAVSSAVRHPFTPAVTARGIGEQACNSAITWSGGVDFVNTACQLV